MSNKRVQFQFLLQQYKYSMLQESDSDFQISESQLNKVYNTLLKKKNINISEELSNVGSDKNKNGPNRERSRSRDRIKKKGIINGISIESIPNRQEGISQYISDFQMFKYNQHQIDLRSISENIRNMPVYKKHDIILDQILKNQVVLVTGDTGCGKSTQIPRIIYEYLTITKTPGKILCVQPRRLAALNLQKILSHQMNEIDVVSYHIGMKNNIRPTTKILFMTNGIFLQRFIHNVNQLVSQYQFIILDQVHQRDIDTDFILLSIKCILRKFPKLRVVLMSATIDNQLFRYYFSNDHIDNFFKNRNYYLRCMQLDEGRIKKRKRSESQDSDIERKKQQIAFEFMKSRKPCPAIQITEKGAFSKQIYYLDTLKQFTQRAIDIKWGSMTFNQRVPILIKQCYQIAAVLLDQITRMNRVNKHSVLVFLPGIMQIQMFCNAVTTFFGRKDSDKNFDIIQLHSTTLNEQITKRLHQSLGNKSKLIVATNIAQSSITVPGVKYIIDFCMTKEVKFDHKSRLESLELIWASQASCNQRAGRTGRVCDGFVFRLVQQKFYESLQKYSTPEIQRCSLDRVILRIMLLHDQQIKNKTQKPLFKDPAEVLGKAIQPPALENIGASIISLLDHGGLEKREDGFLLTELGKLFVQLPIDISYSRMLVLSILFGTFQDILILVSILSQHKNPFRKDQIERSYLDYWDMINDCNYYNCDFFSLVHLYRKRDSQKLPVDMCNIKHYEVQDLKNQLKKRLNKYQFFRERKSLAIKDQDHPCRFKFTIAASFLQHLMVARMPSHDERTEKKINQMNVQGIPSDKTLIINSSIIKKSGYDEENDRELRNYWSKNIIDTFRLSERNNQNLVKIILNYGLSYIVFKKDKDLHKVLFCKYMEESKHVSIAQEDQIDDSRANGIMNFPTANKIKKSSGTDNLITALGDIQYLHTANTSDYQKNSRINVDPFSINRVVHIPYGKKNIFLVTNSKVQKATGSYCRYTSLLPDQRGICPILYLIFHPYAHLKTDKKRFKYQSVQLKKKVIVPLDFTLTNANIVPLNELREILKNFYSLGPWQTQKYQSFWNKLKKVLTEKRDLFIDEDRWQEEFLKVKNIITLKEIKKQSQNTLQKQVHFMQPIEPLELNTNYFSLQHLQRKDYYSHINLYNQWKKQILTELDDIKKYIFNTETLLICGQCQAEVCKLRDVGPTEEYPFRSFTPIPNALKFVPFNDMGDYFCSMMISIPLEINYNVYGCANDHILAFKFDHQTKYKITSFSNLQIFFPDYTTEQADFNKLQIKQWNSKAEKAIRAKRNKKYKTICKICDETFNYLSEMEKHLIDYSHLEMVKQFKFTLSPLQS